MSTVENHVKHTNALSSEEQQRTTIQPTIISGVKAS